MKSQKTWLKRVPDELNSGWDVLGRLTPPPPLNQPIIKNKNS